MSEHRLMCAAFALSLVTITAAGGLIGRALRIGLSQPLGVQNGSRTGYQEEQIQAHVTGARFQKGLENGYIVDR